MFVTIYCLYFVTLHLTMTILFFFSESVQEHYLVILYLKVSLLHITCAYYYNNNKVCIIPCK